VEFFVNLALNLPSFCILFVSNTFVQFFVLIHCENCLLRSEHLSATWTQQFWLFRYNSKNWPVHEFFQFFRSGPKISFFLKLNAVRWKKKKSEQKWIEHILSHTGCGKFCSRQIKSSWPKSIEPKRLKRKDREPCHYQKSNHQIPNSESTTEIRNDWVKKLQNDANQDI